MGRLKGKVAIVTGGGSGMGREESIAFVKEGAKVAVLDCDIGSGNETVNIIKKTSGDATFIYADVSKAIDVRKAIRETVKHYGKLDVMVNGAGINPKEGSILECPEKTFERTIDINLKGIWLCMKHAIPEMIRTGGGSIINIASNCVFRGVPNVTAYTASKGGIIAMSRAVAVGFAPHNIRVNCIAPGAIETPMLLSQWGRSGIKVLEALTPMKTIGSMGEVAKLAIFLASDESSHITAQTIVIDGGQEANAMLGT